MSRLVTRHTFARQKKYAKVPFYSSFFSASSLTTPNVMGFTEGEVLKGLVNYGGSVDRLSTVESKLMLPRYRAGHAMRSAKCMSQVYS